MECVLKCEELTKNYGRWTALKNVNLNIEKGKIIGLLGPNGSGKTTLIRLAAGLLTPTGGNITVCGNNIGIESKKIVSYLPDKLCLPVNKRVSQIIEFYSDFFADFDAGKAIRMLKDLDITPESRLLNMSKGTKDKVQLILTMSRQAHLYLLDEPIGGVDPAARDYILNTIIRNYNENASVIFSTHLIADVEKVLDEVVFINKGEIALHKNVDEIRQENGKSIDDLFREVYKC